MGSMPSTGQIKTTAVPLHTARPSCLVSSVSLNGSSGSLKHSVVLSNTTFSRASKPFKTPVASLPPWNFTRTLLSRNLDSSNILSFFFLSVYKNAMNGYKQISKTNHTSEEDQEHLPQIGRAHV